MTLEFLAAETKKKLKLSTSSSLSTLNPLDPLGSPVGSTLRKSTGWNMRHGCSLSHVLLRMEVSMTQVLSHVGLVDATNSLETSNKVWAPGKPSVNFVGGHLYSRGES